MWTSWRPLFYFPSIHSLCNYFLTNGHLGCSQYFVIINNPAKNTLCICVFILMDVYLQGRLLKARMHIGSFAKIPSRRVALVYIPISNVWECLFPMISPTNFVVKLVFASLKGEIVSKYCSNLHFSDYKWVWTLFLYVRDNFYSIWELLFMLFPPSFSIGFWSFVPQFLIVLYMLWMFSLTLLSFNFGMMFFCHAI